jgi:hypothetical protein
MNRSKRVLLIIAVILVVVAIAAAVTYHVIRRPGKSVYLLPDGNIMAYVSFKPFHYTDLGNQKFESDPEYQDFVAKTGFHFQKDLDSVAFSGRTTGELNEDVSGIVTGTFDESRLNSYLQALPGVESESYGGKTILAMRESNQTVRYCILDSTTVAITAGPSSGSMHSIIDKSRGSGSMPQLLSDYYGEVPFASVGWAIVRVPDLGGQEGPGGFNLEYLKNSVTIISARYTGSVRLRAELIAETEADATKIYQALNGLVAMGRAFATSGQDRDNKDLEAIIDNAKLEQSGKRVVLNVVVPQDVIKKASEKR